MRKLKLADQVWQELTQAERKVVLSALNQHLHNLEENTIKIKFLNKAGTQLHLIARLARELTFIEWKTIMAQLKNAGFSPELFPAASGKHFVWISEEVISGIVIGFLCLS